ncbi:hypothetical protein GCM10025886_13990 [Tetragenococcus halophilus subsp. flandriensis]|uniref:type II toxin-antitoxin system YafQ family toxin n=1 Tax=Tetragenococcus halophilus TaxID=51669 RepID=UPI0023E8FEDE|nr:type II toxin-antitoxin system YafQ family toxin [Tetragenococcus halophilus]GMA08248.1 hypothetical protein GCM10025886_13990 [Tetragenococcus halophilus subsp. flandriensis]
MYEVFYTNRFKKDMKRCHKKGLPLSEIDTVVKKLRVNDPLSEKYKRHSLKGDYVNCEECHIRPDWLLIFKIHKDVSELELIRTGSHSDLFN